MVLLGGAHHKVAYFELTLMGDVKKVVVLGGAHHKVQDPQSSRQLWSNYHFLMGDFFL